MPQNQLFVKRVIGLPGEHLRIADGQLFINETNVVITNALGQITFPGSGTGHQRSDIQLAPDEYFVIGDNITNSLDSRTFGPVLRKNIKSKLIGP